MYLNRFSRHLLVAILLLCATPTTFAAPVDIHLNAIGPYFSLIPNNPPAGWTWAGSGIGALSNYYIFTPTIPDAGICLYIQNLSTWANTFSATIAVTGNPSTISYLNNTAAWQTLTNGGITARLAGSSITSFYFRSSGAANIAVGFASSTGNGNGMLFIGMTTQGGCGSNPAPQVSPVRQLAAVAFASGTSWSANACIVNPGVNAPIVLVAPSGSSAYSILNFERARISTTTAGQINTSSTIGQGTTCTEITADNKGSLNLNNGNLPASITFSATCGAVPTISFVNTQDQVAANTPIEIDLTGFTRANFPTVGGIEITTPAAIAGTVCGTIWFSEIK